MRRTDATLVSFGIVFATAVPMISVATGAIADELSAPPADLAAPPAEAETTESGLASIVLAPGSGEAHPERTSRVEVHYTGWTTDGKRFDSSIERGEPNVFRLDGVLPGWTEGVQLMVEGEKRRFWIPEALAYDGKAGLPAGDLVFDIELLEILRDPQAPEHLTAPPPDAELHKKGLASKVLKAGDGLLLPRYESTVKVHYTGWTTDGKMIDSSVVRGEPATFPLSGVIRGWSQGVQLMVEGEKRRFWIPAKLAYKGDKTKPQGMLIFDIELLAIPKY